MKLIQCLSQLFKQVVSNIRFQQVKFLKSNIFLRCDQNDLKIKLNMENEENFKVFRKVRDLKDTF